jgi:putative phage-type endonuclease
MADRTQFIGGSDIAAVMGASRWKTPLQLWSEKAGKVDPDDLSNNEAVQLGIELENFVAKKFERETGKKVRRAPDDYIHPDHSMFRCQVDRLVTGTDEILEAKTCSAWKAKEWEGENIPMEYILQVSWQLYITGRKVGWIAVLIGGQKFRYKRIEADPELFMRMEEAALQFWQMVKVGVPPLTMAEDNSFIAKLYPYGDERMIEAHQDLIDAIDMLQQTKAEIIELEKTKKGIEARLKGVIGEHSGIETPKYSIKWINVKGSTFTVTKKDSRMLKIIKKKGQ